MKLLSKEEAEEELNEYKEIIVKAFDMAVSDASARDHSCLDKRTRANLIRDFAVYNLRKALKGETKVKVLEKDNTVLFRFGESIIGRIKKLDKKFNASYNLTPSSEKFTRSTV